MLKALFYGDSGAGKTHLIGTATQDSRSAPVLVLNARGQPITFNLFEEPPLVLDVQSMKDFNDPYTWIKSGQPWKGILNPPGASLSFTQAVYLYFQQREGYESPEQSLEMQVNAPSKFKFKTVAIDGITWTQRVSLNAIVGNTSVMPGDMPQQTQIQHWGRTLAQMTNLADLYFQLPIHVLMTALCRHDKIEAYGQVMFYPFIWGQSSLELPSLAELVGRIMPIETVTQQQAMALKQLEGDTYDEAWNILLTKGGRTFLAKWQGVRSNPGVFVAPTIPKLLDYLAE